MNDLLKSNYEVANSAIEFKNINTNEL